MPRKREKKQQNLGEDAHQNNAVEGGHYKELFRAAINFLEIMVVSANIDLSIGRIMRYPIFTHRDVKSFFSRHLSIFCCFFSCLKVEIVFIVVVR